MTSCTRSKRISLTNSVLTKSSAYSLTWGSASKTPTSLALAEVNNCSKVLIVTINGKALEPVTEPGSWLNWASRSTFKFDFLNKFSEPDAFALTKSLPQLFIINYEGLFKHGKRSTRSSGIVLNENITEFLKACRRENVCVIIDESHKVKNL